VTQFYQILSTDTGSLHFVPHSVGSLVVDSPLAGGTLIIQYHSISPSLPPALSLQYSRPIVSLLLEELVGGQADVDAVNICTESLAYLARNCPHAWDKELLRSAMEPVSAVSREANYQTRLSGLDCLAAFMAIPISWGQHNEAMMVSTTRQPSVARLFCLVSQRPCTACLRRVCRQGRYL
jgi:hypothetical protein